MDAEMDIDVQSLAAAQSSKRPESSPEPVQSTPQSLSKNAQSLLRNALFPFFRKQISLALGEDMISYYLPPDDATTSELLRFILSKWLGLFADSPLSNSKRVVNDLYETIRACPAGIATSQSTALSIANFSEQILDKIGASSSAAHVQQLTRTPPSHKPARRRQAQSDNIDVQMNDGSDLKVSYPACHPIQRSLASQYTQDLTKMPVVLDGSNIAWRHGNSQRFSIRGAAEALQYFLSRGHPTVLFLPEARLRSAPPEKHVAEDGPAYEAIKALEGSQILVTTPEADYDDSYICHFARQYFAIVVSNDAFADQVYQASADDESEAHGWKSWFAQCRLSFTFHSHAFIPNPCFNYAKAATACREFAFKS